jgi:hypothetical protein
MRFYLRNPIKTKFVVKHGNLFLPSFDFFKKIVTATPWANIDPALWAHTIRFHLLNESNKKSFGIEFIRIEPF